MAKDTIAFVPTRLNLAPVVFRGMTGREVGLVACAGLVAGIPVGVGAMFIPVIGAFAMVPTGMALTAGAFVWFGGAALRRIRRGRPETWLYRRIQYELARHGLNRADLIVQTDTYRTGRRSVPPRKRGAT
ncbi:TIGR03750 family conjugal transfer protein [Salinisphaera orenii]|uniref:TIGR03750 family conjugal transfer protein n=1 Tax=Salinisphaera orenii TaxID=856731 RepID=UPI000DBE6A5D